MSETSFGERALALGDASALLALEAQEGRRDRFSEIDVAIAGIIIRAARGERVVHVSRNERGDSIEIVGVPDELKASLARIFQLEAQQSRGAWFLPDAVSIKARGLVFGALFREAPRYVHTLASEEKGKITLAGNPDAMVVWSVLEPLAEMLLGPIFVRVDQSGLLEKAQFQERWAEVEADLVSLGLDVSEELAVFRWGGGWARLAAEEIVAAKARLLSAIASRLDATTVQRFRAACVASLIRQYYAKAKKGRAKRRQVVTKEYARILAGFFAGDWLDFVNYLGEDPHDEERVVTALPEARLLVSGKERALDAAARRGIPAAEAERILGALWKDASGNSPVLDRAAALAEYWKHFDLVHARQQRGMPPLWGLVEEGAWSMLGSGDTPYRAALYRRVLPAELNARIDRLWATTVLERWPDRIVTEPFPHSAMADAFGPALKFWHGCALTAWFVCEGPTSRTDIAGLAEYHRRELAALDDVGCPVHPSLFDELSSVRLGPEEPIYASHNQIVVAGGLSLNVSMSSGSRRAGFELLRDVITRHRQWWASHYLEPYLKTAWETELKATARQYHRMTEEKGKAPTLKQFAKHAIAPARRWFAGDVSLLYSSIGQKMPGEPQRVRHMPNDPVAFSDAVFAALGGLPFERRTVVASREEGQAQAEEQGRHHQLRRLAVESITYVQLWEALGRPPTLKEFGSRFEWPSKVLAEDTGAAWETFGVVIQRVLAH